MCTQSPRPLAFYAVLVRLRRPLAPILVAILFLVYSPAGSANFASRPLFVMIDPGHGGADTGASRGELKESEIALKVAIRLADILEKDPRFKIALTRKTDYKVALAKRVELAEAEKVDLFLSIHLNSSSDPRAHGTEIYFQNQLPADEEALYLLSREGEAGEALETGARSRTDSPSIASTGKKAEALSTHSDLKRIIEDLQRNHRIQISSEFSKTLFSTLIAKGAGQRLGSRAIRQAPFHVVSATKIPSVLVELGFLTNAQDGARLAQANYLRQLAETLAQGLINFRAQLIASDLEPSSSGPVPVPPALR